MNSTTNEKGYQLAREQYAQLGVDTEEALRALMERWLGPDDLRALGKSMAERRSVPFPPR